MTTFNSTEAIIKEFKYLHLQQLLVKEIKTNDATPVNLDFDAPLIGRIEKTADETLEAIIYSDNVSLHRPLFKLPFMLTHWCRKLVNNQEEFHLYYNRRIAGSGGYHVVTVVTNATYTTMLPSKLKAPKEAGSLYKSYREDCQKCIDLCHTMVAIRQDPLWSLIFKKSYAIAPYRRKAEALATALAEFNLNFKLVPIQESLSEILLVCIIGNDFLQLVEDAELKQSVSVIMQELNQKCCSLFHADQWVEYGN